ncbi:MAG: CRTAC1 family protein [Acidobacteria bacterium]|nr:CRTAC1 family protein [Acidobacteriota bacterium]MBI3281410.1 CRTAC1 family protein [Acidobacteriota bacterium]
MTRRHRLILRHTLLGGSLVLLASGALLVVRERPKSYSPGERVEGITSELERGIPPGHPAVRFVDVARQAGITFRHFPGRRSTQLPEDMGSGAAWGDYDNDGDADLYVCDIAAPLTATAAELAASPGGNRLYRNNGDGTFTDVTAHAGVGFKGVAMAAAWADYDNDSRLDLAVTSYGRLVLYRNRGGGTFEDVSRAAGLADLRGFWTGASWADYDRDGYADLYICGYVKYAWRPELSGRSSKQFEALVPFTLNPSSYPPERNLLLRNNREGTFTESAAKAGVQNPGGRSLSAAWSDFDGDGWPDLYIANDVSDNAMYRNLGNGRFEDISHKAWVADYRGAMGLAAGDWDNDGDFDIFVTHWTAQENALFWNMRFSQGVSKPAELKFTDVADMTGLGQVSLSTIGWGTSFFDYDHDGRLDLFVANGSTFQDETDPSRLAPMKNFLFWQKSAGEGFFELGRISGEVFAQAHVGRGAAFADYDNDGDIDIFVVNHGGAPLLLRNEGGNAKPWLKVRVRPTQSRTPVGALVEIEAGGMRQVREIGSQPSYLSQNALEAHFGLGPARQVDRVRVRFAAGGVRELKRVAPNQAVTVEQ